MIGLCDRLVIVDPVGGVLITSTNRNNYTQKIISWARNVGPKCETVISKMLLMERGRRNMGPKTRFFGWYHYCMLYL